MKLHDLKPAPGSTKRRIRVGRGIAAGKGKTAGRGTKGQKSRSGASIPGWFEGGQTPIHVRVPKLRGFKRRGRIEYQVVNIGRISEYAAAGRFGEGAGSEPLTVNAEVLAALFGVHPRSLQRLLKQLGTSVDEIRDSARRDRAMQFMRSSESVRNGELAELLGFSSAPAFSRAFKRWTGLSPSEFRRRL